MALIDLPKELTKSYWDKKKGAVPAGSPLETQLKTFEKKSAAVDMSAFAAGWEKKAATVDELKAAYAAVDRAFRTKVLALKLEAAAVAEVAQKLLKDKGLAKPTLDAVKDIGDAAKTFGKAVDAGLADLEKTHDKAAAILKDKGGDDEEEPGSALVDPARLLGQLRMCKRMPERRVAFAFVADGQDEPVFSLAPKMTASRLFAKLKDETGMKTGSFGRAWILEQVLYLEMEKPLSGLVKRVRGSLRTVGFKVKKIVLAGPDGAELESDEAPEEADDPSTLGTAAPSVPGTAAPQAPAESAQVDPDKAAFAALLRVVGPQATQAAARGGPHAGELKLKSSEAVALGRQQAWGQGLAVLQELQRLLAAAGDGPATPAASTPASPADKGSRVVFAQLRLEWESSKKSVQQQLDELNRAILDDWDDGEAVTAAGNLKKVLARFNEGLGDSLDDLYNAATPIAQQEHAARAGAIAERYLDYLAKDALVAHVEANPYDIPIDVRGQLSSRLTTLKSALSRVAA